MDYIDDGHKILEFNRFWILYILSEKENARYLVMFLSADILPISFYTTIRIISEL